MVSGNFLLNQSDLLVEKSWKEFLKDGKIKVVCPKCGQIPKVSLNGNRRRLSCDCRYLFDGEIFF